MEGMVDAVLLALLAMHSCPCRCCRGDWGQSFPPKTVLALRAAAVGSCELPVPAKEKAIGSDMMTLPIGTV